MSLNNTEGSKGDTNPTTGIQSTAAQSNTTEPTGTELDSAPPIPINTDSLTDATSDIEAQGEALLATATTSFRACEAAVNKAIAQIAKFKSGELTSFAPVLEAYNEWTAISKTHDDDARRVTKSPASRTSPADHRQTPYGRELARRISKMYMYKLPDEAQVLRELAVVAEGRGDEELAKDVREKIAEKEAYLEIVGLVRGILGFDEGVLASDGVE